MEALESRTLLSSALPGTADDPPAKIDPTISLNILTPSHKTISADHASDIIFDPTRNQLLITFPNRIDRFDVATLQKVGSIPVGASSGGDITADGRFLYVSNWPSGDLYKIDLDTGSAISIPAATNLQEAAPNDIALGTDIAVVTQNPFYSPQIDRVRTIDLDDNEVHDLERSGSPVVFNSAYGSAYGFVARSADHHHVFVAGPGLDYQIGAGSAENPPYVPTHSLAVSRDGALHALGTNFGISIVNDSFQVVKELPISPAGLAFDPAGDVLYVANTTRDLIEAYDTNTWSELFDLPIGAHLLDVYRIGMGTMTVSNDGQSIFLLGAGSVHVFNLAQSTPTLGDDAVLIAHFSSPDPTSAPASGYVSFLDETTGYSLGDVTISSESTFIRSNLTHAGNHSIIASYHGNDVYNPATSAPASISVNRATPTALFAQNSATTATAAFNGRLYAVTGGTATLSDGQTIIATSGVEFGEARLTFTPVAQGFHSFKLSFSGNDDYNPIEETVTLFSKWDTTITLTGPSSLIYNEDIVEMTATVNAPASGGLVNSGRVVFTDQNGIVDVRSVVDGKATLRVGFAPGKYQITARYESAPQFNDSVTSTPTPFTMRVGPTNLGLIASSNFLPTGQAVSLKAHVSGYADTIAAPGAVTFKDGRHTLGTVPLTNGSAQFTWTPSKGSYSVCAFYKGQELFDSSHSRTIPITVTPFTTVDLMVLYTNSTYFSGVFSSGGIESLINKAVADTNKALLNSRIPVTIRLVHTELVNYYESGDLHTDLTRLALRRDGFMDNIHQLRNTYGADLVSLFVESGNLGGLAYELTGKKDPSSAARGFSVVRASQAGAPYFSLAHELGHNLGATHDVQHAEGKGATAFSNGWRFRGKDGALYHDIMSYDPGHTIPYFSNPRIKYQGVPTGNADSADSARTITLTAKYVAAYRR